MKPKNYTFSINKSSACLANYQLGLTLLALLFAGHLMAQTPQLVSTDALNPKYLTEYNDQLFFSADDANGKNWLWSTDGTTTSKRSYSAPVNFPGTQPLHLKVFNNQLILSSILNEGGAYHRELFKFDGTGPILLKNINNGGESNPEKFTEFNGNLYFSADDGANGEELWSTDGTESGTHLVRDINPGAADSYPIIYDGGIEYDGKLLFNAQDNTNGQELWITDGSSSGTNLLTDINSGFSSSIPAFFTVFNNKVIFSANNSVNGGEPWVTDGTNAGTHLLKDINPGTDASTPYNFTGLNGKLYFAARDGSHGLELWVTDGTEAGTELVKDIYSGSEDGSPLDFTEYHGKLYFGSEDYATDGLWETDGTATGTLRTKQTSSRPENLFTYDDRLYFVADDNSNSRQLWVSDGTAAGTNVVAPNAASNGNPIPPTAFEHLVVDGTLYYTADYDGNGVVLWKLTTNNLSVEDHKESEFTVYPNPVQDILHLDTKSGTIQKIDLFSITGQRLKSWEGKADINLSQYAPGSYFVKITAQDGKTVVKQVAKK